MMRSHLRSTYFFWVCLSKGIAALRVQGQRIATQCALGVLLSILGVQPAAHAAENDLSAWLQTLHEAPLKHSYQGTMVISVDAQMVTAKITHALDGQVPVERVDVMTGQSRTSFRHGNLVFTHWPEAKRWVSEERTDLGVFPGATGAALERVGQFYRLVDLGEDRVAGRRAQVFDVLARDDRRWSYRVWRDQKTHLILKIQTLSVRPNEVLEQSAFTTLETDRVVDAASILRNIHPPEGYELSRLEVRAVNPESLGLRYAASPSGFLPVRAQLPKDQQVPQAQQPLQWLFTDGLANVSVFFEPSSNASSATIERAIRQGATHTLLRETPQMRLTLVGEAPLQTLVQMANGITLNR